ncbi:CDP-diacylglycerol--serine O-phosphatidyltransferase [Methanolapillus ohkumae]|uniref:CDP-diacylglycerol--serine O-phosphatidyltransferase n=1 Tax=Methanolapillus ohkumae TaxID=3028298 RepID=A0AA96ZXT6_9EURY|nr:hypothetical protein MsAm2_12070 [Methanosarcinaceae archaeon Am2]
MFKLIKPPDYVSLANLLFGMIGIFLALSDAFSLAAVCLLLAAVADGMDGYIARKTSSGPLGEHIDSLVDTISFGVLPAVIIYSMSSTAVTAVFAIFYVMCGVLRLARYNAFPPKNHEYSGIPITGAAVFVASLVILFGKLPFSFNFLPDLVDYSAGIFIVVIFVLSLLMVSTIPYTKVIRAKVFLFILFVFFLTLFSVFFTGVVAEICSGVLFLLMMIYLISPLFRWVGKKKLDL